MQRRPLPVFVPRPGEHVCVEADPNSAWSQRPGVDPDDDWLGLCVEVDGSRWRAKLRWYCTFEQLSDEQQEQAGEPEAERAVYATDSENWVDLDCITGQAYVLGPYEWQLCDYAAKDWSPPADFYVCTHRQVAPRVSVFCSVHLLTAPETCARLLQDLQEPEHQEGVPARPAVAGMGAGPCFGETVHCCALPSKQNRR